MNLITKFWNWFTTPNSDSSCELPTPVEVEEEVDDRNVAEIFYDICRESGISHKDITRLVLVPAFVDWYDGDADEQSIRDCINSFKDQHPKLRPKLARLN